MNDSGRKSFVVFFIFLLVAFFDAIYLTYHHYLINVLHPDIQSFCSINSVVDCDSVAASEWAWFLGLPVSSMGMFSYLFILMFIGGTYIIKKERLRDHMMLLYPVMLSMVVFTLYEFYASVFWVKSLCLMCILLYLCIFIMTIASKVFLQLSPKKISFVVRECFIMLSSLKKNMFLLKLIIVSFFVSVVFAYVTDRCINEYFQNMVVLNKVGQHDETDSHDDGSNDSSDGSLLLSQTGIMIKKFKEMPSFEFDLSNAPMVGRKNATIEIVEFSDFQCPACGGRARSLKMLVNEFSGKVKLYFKHYPLDHHCNPEVKRQFHPGACLAARYASCAFKQDKFWELHDFLFSHRRSIEVDLLETQVSKMKLNMTKFHNCLKNDAKKMVMLDIFEANKLGIDYTPTIFLNNKKVSDIAGSFDDYRELIRAILNEEM